MDTEVATFAALTWPPKSYKSQSQDVRRCFTATGPSFELTEGSIESSGPPLQRKKKIPATWGFQFFFPLVSRTFNQQTTGIRFVIRLK